MAAKSVFIYLIQFMFLMMVQGEQQNLTKITWAHAVNSVELLTEALATDVMMLEADIVLGTMIGSSQIIPIMAHPPATTSDLSLERFLADVDLFNSENIGKEKGVKLDFKSIDAFEKSITLIEKIDRERTYPLWVNADILKGPVNATNTPVDPGRFLDGCKDFKRATLSIGWTTKYSFTDRNATYNANHVQEMLNLIKSKNVTLPITYPVRAGIVANSLDSMVKLLIGTQNTLTIWSSEVDFVNVDYLRNVIFSIGLNKTYIDVPKSLMDKLHLDNPPESP